MQKVGDNELTKLHACLILYFHFIFLVQHSLHCALDSTWYLINILRLDTCLHTHTTTHEDDG